MTNYGRSTVWFLEKDLTEEMYQLHKREVEQSLKHSTWRSLMAIIIDTRLWQPWNQDASMLQDVLNQTDPWSSRVPTYYREIRGRITFYWQDHQGQGYLRIILDKDHQTIFDCPIQAMISYRSTGFPKIAYSPEKYLIGYRIWLDYLKKEECQEPIDLINWTHDIPLTSWLLEVNFSTMVYEGILRLITLKKSMMKHHQASWNHEIQQLQTLMIQEMNKDIPEHNQSMYIYTIEWFMDARLLQLSHPLMEAYLSLRVRYPNMVLGKAFIPV